MTFRATEAYARQVAREADIGDRAVRKLRQIQLTVQDEGVHDWAKLQRIREILGPDPIRPPR